MANVGTVTLRRTAPREGIASWTAIVVLVGALVWAYWPTLLGLNKDWQSDQNYSVGQLVPLAALYMLWHDRTRLRGVPIRTCRWGLGIILLAFVVRGAGLVLLFESAERYAIVMNIAGLVLFVTGARMFWRLKWILLFLCLMVPLPGRIHNKIAGPLQDHATAAAVYCLELTGITVNSEGHVIVLNDEVPLAVAEACSGLRMLTAFVVVGATLAYVVGRPPWQKAILVLSTVPVAILCNTVRLVVTAVLFLKSSSELAEHFFHDFAGLTMMPMAIMVLIFELWLMSRIIIADEPVPLDRPARQGVARP